MMASIYETYLKGESSGTTHCHSTSTQPMSGTIAPSLQLAVDSIRDAESAGTRHTL